MSFFAELKRRNVFRVAASYAVVAWLLVEISDTIFPRLTLPDWTVTLVIVLLLLGFPLAVFLAWAYEMTPEGVRRTTELPSAESGDPGVGRKLDSALIAALVLVVGYLLLDKFLLAPTPQSRELAYAPAELADESPDGPAAKPDAAAPAPDGRSIAVLPFANTSDDAANEYFSDGISEELLNLLSKVPGLRVTSRASAFHYKQRNLRPSQVASELNVSHVLEGSVRKAGNRVRITSELVDARSDTRLWSETYDRSLDDIFAVQDEIAAAVVAELKVRLLGEAPQRPETSGEAYSLFLQARHLGRQGNPAGYSEAAELLERVLEIDPRYVAALVELATVNSNQANFGYRPRAEGFGRARELAERALEIDPGYAPALSQLAVLEIDQRGDLAAAARLFERALDLDPTNLDVLHRSAILLISLGRLEEAIDLQKYVAARDPITSAGHHNLGWSYQSSGRWDEAITAFRKTLSLSPGASWAHHHIAVGLVFKGDPQAALESALLEPDPAARLLALAIVNHALGQHAEADRLIEETAQAHAAEWCAYIAAALAVMGETDRAFEWLDRTVALGQPRLEEVILSSLFWKLHDDPRWLPFLESIGQAPAQLAQISFRVMPPR